MTKGASGLERLRTGRVAIWGAGTEGTEVARAAIDRGAEVVFLSDRPRSPGAGEPEQVLVGDTLFPVSAPALVTEARFDCLVRSPGVSVYRDEIVEARRQGCDVTTATAMWFEDFSGSRIVGVTGTKGKTTTAWLTSLLLEGSGYKVGLGGNMGTPLTKLYDKGDCDFYVVEISSFQAADLSVSPTVGLLTLLSPDHLDWHLTYDNYVRDKLNLFMHRSDIEVAVNATDPEVLARSRGLSRRHPYGGDGRVVLEEDDVSVDGARIDVASMPLRGRHNLLNLCGAITACILAGAPVPDRRALEHAFRDMPTLPSRLETVASCSGIEFVNDALASNPAGALAALRTFEGRHICLIAGGQDRGVTLEPLLKEMERLRPQPVLVSLPGVGSLLAEGLQHCSPRVLVRDAQTVHEAVKLATSLVGEWDDAVVLFSPAAPTPLSEGSYVQRGALFNKAVSDFCRSRA